MNSQEHFASPPLYLQASKAFCHTVQITNRTDGQMVSVGSDERQEMLSRLQRRKPNRSHPTVRTPIVAPNRFHIR